MRRQLRGPPAGRQVDRAAHAGVSSSRAPGAQTAQQAASRAPALSLRIQAAGGRAGSSFLSCGPNHIDPPLTFPGWEAGGRARSERSGGERGPPRPPQPCLLPLGRSAALKLSPVSGEGRRQEPRGWSPFNPENETVDWPAYLYSGSFMEIYTYVIVDGVFFFFFFIKLKRYYIALINVPTLKQVTKLPVTLPAFQRAAPPPGIAV